MTKKIILESGAEITLTGDGKEEVRGVPNPPIAYIDPVVDKSLEQKDIYNQGYMDGWNNARKPLSDVIKESKSTAIEDYFNKLRKWCEIERVEMEYSSADLDNKKPFRCVYTRGYERKANDLLKYAEELKLKIDKGE